MSPSGVRLNKTYRFADTPRKNNGSNLSVSLSSSASRLSRRSDLHFVAPALKSRRRDDRFQEAERGRR
jgi:hypothetical protein